jgi:quercetin dioxygenase-like cupin family protein
MFNKEINMNNMQFVPRSLVIGLLLILLMGCNLVIAPPVPAAVPAAQNPVAELAGEFEVVQLIVDFPAGTWTPSHTHGGMLLVTVTAGELTVRDEQGAERVYKTGESFTETPGPFLEIGNAGESLASVATVALLPKGAKLTTVKEGISTDSAPPGPTVLYQNRQAVSEPLGEFELLQLVSDFAPGAWTPIHMHGAMLLVTVLNGEITVRDAQGVEQTYRAGESFMELPGVFLEVGNAGESLASVATAALLPAGAKLTTVKEGISTDTVPPGPTLLYQSKMAANSVVAP